MALAKAPLTAADLLNDRVVPFYDQHEVKLSRMLADRDTEFCANPERHGYELYLAVEDVDHSRTKTRNPHTNGIAERIHKTVLDEFYRVAFRKRTYGSIAQLQADLDEWIRSYNESQPYQGRWCSGKAPIETLLDAVPLAREKLITACSLSERRDRPLDANCPIRSKLLDVRRCWFSARPTTRPGSSNGTGAAGAIYKWH